MTESNDICFVSRKVYDLERHCMITRGKKEKRGKKIEKERNKISLIRIKQIGRVTRRAYSAFF